MAFNTPATAVALTALTAGWLNTYVRDNIAWMATDSPAVRAYNNANLAWGTGVDTVVTLNSERFDNAAMHSTSSNTSRGTVPAGGAGKYLFGSLVEFAANVTGGRGCHIKMNGTTYIAKSVVQGSTGAGDTTSMTVTSSYALIAADYVEMWAYQSSGGFLNINSASAYSPELWAYWLRT